MTIIETAEEGSGRVTPGAASGGASGTASRADSRAALRPDSGALACLRKIRAGWLPLALALIFLCISTLLSNPFERFPINDEWAYGYPIESILKTGKLIYPATTSFALTQISCALPVCAVFGFSYGLLRLIGLSFGLLACFAMYKIARELSLTKWHSGIFALVIATNPFVINLSNSFMSDVPAIALNLLTILFFCRAIKSERSQHWWLASLFLCGSIASRQTALIYLPALTIVLLFRLAHKKKIALPVLTLLVAPLVAYSVLASAIKSATLFTAPSSAYHAAFVQAAQNWLQNPALCMHQIWHGTAILCCYLSLFCLPLTLPMCIAAVLQKKPSRCLLPVSVALVIVGSSLIDLIYSNKQTMPFSQNLSHPPFVGVYCLLGATQPSIVPDWLMEFTIFTSIAAVAFAAISGSALITSWRQVAKFQSRCKPGQGSTQRADFDPCFAIFNAVSFLSILAFLLVQTTIQNLDRYYLFLLPNALCLIAVLWKYLCRFSSSLAALSICVIIGFLGITESFDFHSFAHTREKCISFLESHGASPQSIDGGPEYNLYSNLNLLQWFTLDPAHPATAGYVDHARGNSRTQKLRWWPVTGEDYVVSMQELPGYELKFTSCYWSPLMGSNMKMFALKKAR